MINEEELDTITIESIDNFKRFISDLYTANNFLDLKKLLGVLYAPITNALFEIENDIDTETLERLGLNNKGIEYLLRVATYCYINNDFKEYGDINVVEPLSYFSFEDCETIERYWERI